MKNKKMGNLKKQMKKIKKSHAMEEIGDSITNMKNDLKKKMKKM